MLTIGTIVFGSEFAIGKNALSEPSLFHMVAGYLVFLVAIGGMVLIAKFLTNFSTLWAQVPGAMESLRKSVPTAADTRSTQKPPPPPGSPDKKQEDDY